MKSNNLFVLSDACLGYGSPQIPVIARRISEEFGCKITIIEPGVPESPPRYEMFPDIQIVRVTPTRHVYNEGGRAAYLNRAAAIIEMERPEILIVCCSFTLPVLLKIRFRPKLVIYYAIESIIQYGLPDSALHHAVHDLIDYVVFPEENRAYLDGRRCGLLNKPFSIVLNSSDGVLSDNDIISPHHRNGRIIHQGTIGVMHTYSNYFLDRRIRRLPIDIYGPLVDDASQSLRHLEQKARRDTGNFSAYRGRIDIASLARIRNKYLYSICIWNPDDERGRYAPSNKFFEAISSGVPPLTAPHPQHERLIKEFDCGLMLEGWSFKDFRRGLLMAIKVSRTKRYVELVENCILAARLKLNSRKQLQSMIDVLRERFAEKLENGANS
jgi:hypothetical protein